ncbi:MotA/TolQ/ExbB proton channel family protein [Labilithrix luteola]|uniref:MotA/TolQ/ExbB proton channel family protein n=1 Tax=Labilithrix luteola TaxID=1391654 RepID=A0A0K1PTW5_9BACT|nr:MotA/TolQ/ExbB proton channel family protein [Labilithrix luteola]AKU96975.1 MotA/TolQ/ExbB proton channel family protein [Labilithrix luteola]
MQSFNLVEMWHAMGLVARGVVILLVMLSTYSLWVICERFVVFSRVQRQSFSFVLGLRDKMRNEDLPGAHALSQATPQPPIAKVVDEALTEYQEGQEALRANPSRAESFDVVDLVNFAVDRVKEREVATLKKGLGGLASISSAAPFIGLFGTVVGIINAFQSMAATGAGGIGSISAGISEALFTTAVGLSVAIPAVMAFNYFTNAIEQFVVDINDVSSELISYVVKRGEGNG